jgi:hypothetical protein
MLIPKVNDGTLLILSAITSFVIAPIIRSYLQKKAVQDPKYKELLKEREEKLSVLVKKHRSQNL